MGLFAEDMEAAYLSTYLEENMRIMLDNAHADANFRPPFTATMRGYVFTRGEQRPPVPDVAFLLQNSQ